MKFKSHHSEPNQRRYPVLSIFDVTLNFVLCSGVFALACVVLGIILSHSAPHVIAQFSQVATRILS